MYVSSHFFIIDCTFDQKTEFASLGIGRKILKNAFIKYVSDLHSKVSFRSLLVSIIIMLFTSH